MSILYQCSLCGFEGDIGFFSIMGLSEICPKCGSYDIEHIEDVEFKELNFED